MKINDFLGNQLGILENDEGYVSGKIFVKSEMHFQAWNTEVICQKSSQIQRSTFWGGEA